MQAPLQEKETGGGNDDRAPFWSDPIRLAAERQRLVRFCLRAVGRAEVAEDIAQEALALAWQHRDRLQNAAVWQAWVTGIARNLCLRWRRRQALEMRYALQDPFADLVELQDSALPDMDELMVQGEVADLLDRALTTLPPPTRGLLAERYFEDMPVSELAARHGQGEDVTAVQLFRARQALRRALVAPALRPEAIALGLVEAEEARWVETRLWCTRCGKRYLLGYFENTPSGSQEFCMRCPDCDDPKNEHRSAFFRMRHDPTDPLPNPLAGVKSFRPAIKRLAAWWNEYAVTGTREGKVACYQCGAPAPVRFSTPPDPLRPSWSEMPGLYSSCERCDTMRFVSVPRISLHLPEAQRFWGEHPRMVVEPAREVASAAGCLFVTRLQSVTSSAALEVVCARSTLEVVRIERLG